jgi:hypothetical protein
MNATLTDADVVTLAIALARNCGYAVFPCGDDKRPTLRGWPERASTEPATIFRLWHQHPGPLIGIVTGSRNGVDVLDLDVKQSTSSIWWRANEPRLPPTRTFRTRSGGLHLYYRHAEGVRNTASKLAKGIDTRGDGGFVISWFAAGLDCLDHTPPADWPAWLLADLLAMPAPAPMPAMPVSGHPGRAGRAIDGALRRVAGANEGERNAILFWGACRLAERVRSGDLSASEAEALLVQAGRAAGLSEPEARATVRSAMRRAAA